MATPKLRNCQTCKKIFMSNYGEKVCPDCVRAQKELESTVVNFVRENPKSSIAEIMAETGASEAMIRRMIEEGHFVQSGVKLTYPCKKCGKEIIAGQYCDECMKEMQKDLQSAHQKMAGIAAAEAAAARGHGMYSKDFQK